MLLLAQPHDRDQRILHFSREGKHAAEDLDVPGTDVEGGLGEVREGLFPGGGVWVVRGRGAGEGVVEDEGFVFSVDVGLRGVGVGVLVGLDVVACKRVAFLDDAGEEEHDFLDFDIDWLQLVGNAGVRVQVAVCDVADAKQRLVDFRDSLFVAHWFRARAEVVAYVRTVSDRCRFGNGGA